MASSSSLSTSITLFVKRLSATATVPTRATSGAAGYDLSCSVAVIVPARGKQIIPTDLAIALPEGTYGRVAPRSGLAWKSHIDVGAGVIDRDYRGTIEVGDRVAQLILERIAIADVKEVADLDHTDRGVDGFGSTGISSMTMTSTSMAASSSSSSSSFSASTWPFSSTTAATAATCTTKIASSSTTS